MSATQEPIEPLVTPPNRITMRLILVHILDENFERNKTDESRRQKGLSELYGLSSSHSDEQAESLESHHPWVRRAEKARSSENPSQQLSELTSDMIATAKANKTTALELAYCVGWSVQAIKTRSCRTLDVRALRESSIISTELFNQLRKGLDCLGDKPASDLSREMMQGGLHFYEYSRTYRDLYPLDSVTSSSLSLDDIAAQLNETLSGLTATSLVQPTVTISVGGLSFEVQPSVGDEARQASTTEILELLNLSDVSAGDIQSLMTVSNAEGRPLFRIFRVAGSTNSNVTGT